MLDWNDLSVINYRNLIARKYEAGPFNRAQQPTKRGRASAAAAAAAATAAVSNVMEILPGDEVAVESNAMDVAVEHNEQRNQSIDWQNQRNPLITNVSDDSVNITEDDVTSALQYSSHARSISNGILRGLRSSNTLLKWKLGVL